MDFGMPTLIELDSLSDTVSLCKALGLRFVELNMNLPRYQPGRLSAQTLAPFLDGTVYFTIHLDENLDPWHFNPLVSKAYADTAAFAIRIARETGIPLGSGEINIAASLALAREHGCRCVLEVKTVAGLKASAGWMKEHHAGYMGKPENEC